MIVDIRIEVENEKKKSEVDPFFSSSDLITKIQISNQELRKDFMTSLSFNTAMCRKCGRKRVVLEDEVEDDLDYTCYKCETGWRQHLCPVKILFLAVRNTWGSILNLTVCLVMISVIITCVCKSAMGHY